MIGFITTPEIAAQVTESIREAQISRGLPVVWVLQGVPITNGEHAGGCFIPCDDQILATDLRQGMRPTDFPEFEVLVSMLGGLDARHDLEESAIENTNEP